MIKRDKRRELHKPFSLRRRVRRRRHNRRTSFQLLMKAVHLLQHQDKDAEVVDADDEVAVAAAAQGPLLPLATMNLKVIRQSGLTPQVKRFLCDHTYILQ